MLGVRKARVAQARATLKDLEFIERVRASNLVSLEAMLADHSHKATPRWKKVAIRRAISRHRPCDPAWVLGLDEARTDGRVPGDRFLLEETRIRVSIHSTEDNLDGNDGGDVVDHEPDPSGFVDRGSP